jgi:energy-coupling factor transporter ATP-binding protein EcfA2
MWVRGRSNYNRKNEFDPYHKLIPFANKKRSRLQSNISQINNNNNNNNQNNNKKSRHQLSNDDNENELKNSDDDNNNDNNDYDSDPIQNRAIQKFESNLKMIRNSYKLPLRGSIFNHIFQQCESLNLDVNNLNLNLKFDEHQLSAIKSILRGQSTFLTGGSKSGKSTVIKHMAKIFEKNKIKYVYLSGSLANVVENAEYNCQYLKKWIYDIDPQLPDEHKLKEKIVSDKYWLNHFANFEVIMIDDFPCVDYHYFSAIDIILKSVRSNQQSFGGATLVIAGDLAQLSPVAAISNISYKEQQKKRLFFEEPLWLKTNFKNHYLPHDYVHDKSLAQLLRRIRFGMTDNNDIKILQMSVISPSKIQRASVPGFARLKHYSDKIDFTPKFTPVRLFNNADMVKEDRKKVNNFMHKEAKDLNKYVDLNCLFEIDYNFTDFAKNTFHQNSNMLFKQQVQESHIPKSLSLYTGLQIYTTADIIHTTTGKKQDKENKYDNHTSSGDSIRSSTNNTTKTIIIPRGSVGIIVDWSDPEIIPNYRKLQISLPIVKFKYHPDEFVKIYPHQWTNNLNCNANEFFTKNHINDNDTNNNNNNNDDNDNNHYIDIDYIDKNVQNNGTNEIHQGIVCSQLPLDIGWSSYLDETQPQLIYDEIFLRIDDDKNFIDSKFFYNALCRVRYLDGFKLEQFNANYLKLDKRITSFYFQLEKNINESIITTDSLSL